MKLIRIAANIIIDRENQQRLPGIDRSWPNLRFLFNIGLQLFRNAEIIVKSETIKNTGNRGTI